MVARFVGRHRGEHVYGLECQVVHTFLAVKVGSFFGVRFHPVSMWVFPSPRRVSARRYCLAFPSVAAAWRSDSGRSLRWVSRGKSAPPLDEKRAASNMYRALCRTSWPPLEEADAEATVPCLTRDKTARNSSGPRRSIQKDGSHRVRCVQLGCGSRRGATRLESAALLLLFVFRVRVTPSVK
jgi:hypothetical protein